jgi:DNA-binding MarR family transcriptional regulator
MSPTSTIDATLAAELEGALMALWTGLLRRSEGDLSRTGASVLTMLSERPHRITELAAAQSVAQPTMTVAIQRLEARGLVSRERDATDRRATNVTITDAGRQLLALRRSARAAALAERLDALDAAQLRALRDALPALSALSTTSPVPA